MSLFRRRLRLDHRTLLDLNLASRLEDLLEIESEGFDGMVEICVRCSDGVTAESRDKVGYEDGFYESVK